MNSSSYAALDAQSLDLNLTARQLPELRAKLMEYYPDGFPPSPEQTPETRRATQRTLQECELFYITPEMCQLAMSAGESLEVFDLQPSDVIAPQALMYFAKPIHGFGNLLSSSVSQNYMTVGLFLDPRLAVGIAGELRKAADSGQKVPGAEHLDELIAADPADLPVQVRMWCAALPFGERFDTTPVLSVDFPRSLMSALLLMNQSIASSSTVTADRAAQRRIRRAGLPVDDVRVITLRTISGHGSGESVDREWLHQWIVRGHWRQQPCGPGGKDRRPTWIPPHIKGPEDAPLLGGDKVHAWRR